MAFTQVTNGLAGSSTTVTTLAINVASGNVPIGSLVVVGWSCNPGSATTAAVTDSKGNTYTNFASPIFTTNLSLGFSYCLATTAALVLGSDTITITQSQSTTRHAGFFEAFTPSNANAVFDTATPGSFTNDTASPFATSNTPTLSAADDLGLSIFGWIGGAVNSAYAHTAPAGFTAFTNNSSAGATTRVECDHAYKVNMGATTAWSAASTTTSVTRTHGFAIAFSDIAAAAAGRSRLAVVRRTGSWS